MMKESEFHHLAEELFQLIEEAIDGCGVDIDCDTSGGIMTLTFTDKSKIIINKQTPLSQIWVATRFNGYHFDYKEEQWIDNREGNELMALLSAACSSQSGSEVELGQ